MDERKKREGERADEDERGDNLAARTPVSPPRTGRPAEGVGTAVTGPRGVGAPDVTGEDVPARDHDRDKQGRRDDKQDRHDDKPGRRD